MYGWMAEGNFPTEKVGELLAWVDKAAKLSPAWAEVQAHLIPQTEYWEVTLTPKMRLELPEPVWVTIRAIFMKEAP